MTSSSGFSKILLTVLAINAIQYLAIVLLPSENVSWIFVHVMVLPVLFTSYYAARYNKVAYLLQLYWFVLQIFGVRFSDTETFQLDYGYAVHITFFNGALSINPIAVLMFVFTLLEVDRVFPGSRVQNVPVSDQISSGPKV